MLIGVPGRADVGPMEEFVERHGLQGMPQAVDTDGQLWARYGVGYQPAWVFIDDSGEVTVHAGPLDAVGIDARLEELVAQ